MTSGNIILKCTSDRPTVKYIFISLWSFNDSFKYVTTEHHFFRLLLSFRLHNIKLIRAFKMVAQCAETIGRQEYLAFGPLSVLLDPNYGISVNVTSQIAQASELLFRAVTKHFSHSKGNNRAVSRLRRSDTGILLWSPGFDPSTLHVGFTVDKMSQGQNSRLSIIVISAHHIHLLITADMDTGLTWGAISTYQHTSLQNQTR